MKVQRKRVYSSEARDAKAKNTKNRILGAARELFQTEGFEAVTIERLAQAAEVSAPTIYALYQSKRGVLRALMDEALPSEQHAALVEKGKQQSPERRVAMGAKIARKLYDAEYAQMEMFRGASVLAPEFKELEIERERRRYQRQEETVKTLWKEGALAKGMTLKQAQDILWALTGRDMYRMFVVEQGWTSGAYEKWLAQLLVTTLIGSS